MRLTTLIVLSAVMPLLLFPTAALGQAGPSFEERVVELVNAERLAAGGLPPLKRNPGLELAAENHSANMAARDFFAHCDLDNGDTPWDRILGVGYTPVNWGGENVAAGYSTPELAMAGWMASGGHRANILSTSAREIGVGHVYQSGDEGTVRFDMNGDCTADSFDHGPYMHYWTQDFGRRNSVYPVIIEREAYETTSRAVALYVYGTGWAEEMRFRNENDSWSAWQPYAADVSWDLSAGDGLKTVYAELRSGTTVQSVEDEIYLTGQGTTAVADGDGVSPATLVLGPALPNPFQGSTRVSFGLPRAGWVRAAVHDVVGREVAVLIEQTADAGEHEVVWNGTDARGRPLTPGIYFVDVRSGQERRAVKVLLQR